MHIRFLETVESERPGFPFTAGQIISVATPTKQMLAWLRSSRAVVLRQENDEELAVAPEPVEVAVLTKRGPRAKRHAR